MGKILSINISKEKGTIKTPVKVAEVLVDHGIVGDAHAKNWHRQISLLADESIESMRESLDENAFNILKPGVFAENILTSGIDLKNLPIGTQLKIGETIHEVTQIGKECHHGCEIRKIVGDCVMPREGVFTKVIRSGILHINDSIEVIKK
jgi:MOSC domain-containing protein YiiM